MSSNDLCEECDSVFTENSESGKLEFVCTECGFRREASESESLRISINITSKNIQFETPTDIVSDPVNTRIKIDCKCGSKIGVLRMFGDQCTVMKVCYSCESIIH